MVNPMWPAGPATQVTSGVRPIHAHEQEKDKADGTELQVRICVLDHFAHPQPALSFLRRRE